MKCMCVNYEFEVHAKTHFMLVLVGGIRSLDSLDTHI